MTSLWNGAGVVVRADGQGRTGAQVWQNAKAAGATTITDQDHDVHDEGLADSIQKCLNLDGETTPTTDIPWGTNKITGLKAGTARTDAINFGQHQDGKGTYATASGTANAITASLTPAITAYATSQTYRVLIASDNTGAATINFNGVGAKSIHGVAGTALTGGELVANTVAELVYDGTQFVLVGWAAATQQAPFVNKTGFVQDYIGTTAPAGWLILNGDTLGSGDSGADQADDDYEALYTLFWNSFANTEVAVTGGRGANAAADWAADKTLTMLDFRGRTSIGTGQGSGLTARTHGDTGGAETDTTSQGNDSQDREGGGSEQSQDSDHTHSVDIMQPWLALNKIVKV